MKNASTNNYGFKIDRDSIECVSYADDKTLFPRSTDEIHIMLNKSNKKSRKLDMKINVEKMKMMRFTEASNKQVKINIGNETIGSVKEFRYLGSVFTTDDRHIK